MERVVTEIFIDRRRDPDRIKLRELLEAHEAYERMSAARSFSMHLLAIVSVLVWLQAGWPSLLSTDVQVLALGLWGMLFCLALWMSMEEWIWHRRRARYFTQYHRKRKES